MAEVKLDISEYELMKENAKLLQDSLDREKKLSSEIDSLKEEKIQALIDNEKVVTIIKKTSIKEELYSNSPSDVHTANSRIINTITKIVHECMREYEKMNNGKSDPGKFGESFWRDPFLRGHDVGSVSLRHRRVTQSMIEHFVSSEFGHRSHIGEIFFGRTNKIQRWEDDEIITRGLDEVQAEANELALKSLTNKAKLALKENPELVRERDDATDELNNRKKELQIFKDGEKIRIEREDYLVEEVDKLKALSIDNSTKLEEIERVIIEDGFFKRKGIINSVKQILKTNE